MKSVFAVMLLGSVAFGSTAAFAGAMTSADGNYSYTTNINGIVAGNGPVSTTPDLAAVGYHDQDNATGSYTYSNGDKISYMSVGHQETAGGTAFGVTYKPDGAPQFAPLLFAGTKVEGSPAYLRIDFGTPQTSFGALINIEPGVSSVSFMSGGVSVLSLDIIPNATLVDGGTGAAYYSEYLNAAAVNGKSFDSVQFNVGDFPPGPPYYDNYIQVAEVQYSGRPAGTSGGTTVGGTDVPEGSTLALLGGVLVLFGLTRGRRSFAA